MQEKRCRSVLKKHENAYWIKLRISVPLQPSHTSHRDKWFAIGCSKIRAHSIQCFPSSGTAVRCIDYISAPFSYNSSFQGDTVRSAWCGIIIIIVRVLQIKRVPCHRLLMVPPLAAVHDLNSEHVEITVSRHRFGARVHATHTCVRVYVCVHLPLSIYVGARVCRRCVSLYRPGTTLTLTTLSVRPSAHLIHPAVVNYQGSIALTHAAQIRCLWVCVCACTRAHMIPFLMRYGCHLQALVSIQSTKTRHFHSLLPQVHSHSTCRDLISSPS